MSAMYCSKVRNDPTFIYTYNCLSSSEKKKKEPNFVDVPFFSPSSEPIVLTTFPPISHKHATLCMKEILPTGFFTLINRKTHKVSSFSCLWKMLNLEIIPAIATALL